MTSATTIEPSRDDRGRSTLDAVRRSPDAELIALLRAGDERAFGELWSRYVVVARAVARRLAPSDADDLVTDAFLAVHRQIVERGAGPEEDFRSYLLATVRNGAARLRREAARLPVDDDGVPVDDRDGLAVVEREESSRAVRASFDALPERWRRMLWMAEVERVDRSEIASRLGIRPNAASALQRRARAGLRAEWLRRQIPVPLLADAEHAASSLPALITGTAAVRERSRTLAHLDGCARCRELDRELRTIAGLVVDTESRRVETSPASSRPDERRPTGTSDAGNPRADGPRRHDGRASTIRTSVRAPRRTCTAQEREGSTGSSRCRR